MKRENGKLKLALLYIIGTFDQWWRMFDLVEDRNTIMTLKCILEAGIIACFHGSPEKHRLLRLRQFGGSNAQQQEEGHGQGSGSSVGSTPSWAAARTLSAPGYG